MSLTLTWYLIFTAVMAAINAGLLFASDRVQPTGRPEVRRFVTIWSLLFVLVGAGAVLFLLSPGAVCM